MKMEPIECSETSAIRTQTQGNYPKENISHIEHGESLKTRMWKVFSRKIGTEQQKREINQLQIKNEGSYIFVLKFDVMFI